MAPKTLAQKLYIRPDHTLALLNAPKYAPDLLAPLPDNVRIVTNPASTMAAGDADILLIFVKTQADVEKSVKQILNVLDETTIVWFAFPKQKGKKESSEVNRDHGWDAIREQGYQGIATVSIDDTWSGLRFRRGLAATESELIAKQYAGRRASLLPMYEQLVKAATYLGLDVEVAARQSYVAFTRGKQFALVRPARDRIDLALRLPNAPMDGRLVADAAVGSGRLTHRVRITTMEEIDRQLLGWLQDAYRAAAS